MPSTPHYGNLENEKAEVDGFQLRLVQRLLMLGLNCLPLLHALAVGALVGIPGRRRDGELSGLGGSLPCAGFGGPHREIPCSHSRRAHPAGNPRVFHLVGAGQSANAFLPAAVARRIHPSGSWSLQSVAAPLGGADWPADLLGGRVANFGPLVFADRERRHFRRGGAAESACLAAERAGRNGVDSGQHRHRRPDDGWRLFAVDRRNRNCHR